MKSIIVFTCVVLITAKVVAASSAQLVLIGVVPERQTIDLNKNSLSVNSLTRVKLTSASLAQTNVLIQANEVFKPKKSLGEVSKITFEAL